MFLIIGAVAKVYFILKNMFDKLEVPASKKVLILVMVIAQASVEFLALKFALIVNYNAKGQAVHFMEIPPTAASHLSVGHLMFRTHPAL